MIPKAVVIGGGAAGFFAAVNLRRLNPDIAVTLLEKSNKLLAKVRVSGGGRCNVTHACFEDSLLVGNYPRGGRALRGAFSRFSTKDTVKWFEDRNTPLKTEADGRMFPVSDSSESIIRCLLSEAEQYGVEIRKGADVKHIRRIKDGFRIELAEGKELDCDRLLIATGGNSKSSAYDWIRDLGHTIVPPIPSLFTFNIPHSPVTSLMGLSVPGAKVQIAGTKYVSSGPLLITHWGFSGPAVLKLSAWAAPELNARNYEFNIRISWLGEMAEDEIRKQLELARKDWNGRLVIGHPLFGLPRRLWEYFVADSGIGAGLKWADLPKKNLNRMVEKLRNDTYPVKGKTTFKEEFVTCGGVSLDEVDFRTMESRKCPGLYFAGEVLDIDGITGGFNFQSAWTTGFIAASAMAEQDKPSTQGKSI